jgi:large subunit ribosomal protein L32e
VKKPSISAEKVLKLRARAKKQKPSFARQESWRYKRLKENWRKPRGLDNKMRRKIKGWPRTVEVGYRGPKAARGLHQSGFKEVLVYNTEQLWELDPKTQAVKIGHTVGKRKRARIIVEAKKRKITILNFKEPKEVVEEEKELAGEAEKKEAIEEEKAEEAETEKEKPKPKRKRKRRGEEKQ